MFENLSADLARHLQEGQPLWRKALLVAETQGIWAVAVYRFGRWVYTVAPPGVRLPLKLTYHVLHKLIEILTGISIPASCQIGPGLYVGHFGTIILPR
jgi:serine O-acetyltransferase